jgi:signal transduction histidine kinase
MRGAMNPTTDDRMAALRTAVARMGDGLVAFDAGWRYTFANERAAELLGRPGAASLVGRHVWDEFPERVGSVFHRACEQAMATQRPATIEDPFEPRGRWFETRLYPATDGLTVLFTDITARRRSQDALRDSERDFRELAELVPAIIYRAALDAHSSTLYISPRVADLGYPVDLWTGDPHAFARAIHPDDRARVLSAVSDAVARRGELDIAYRMRDAAGNWHHFRDIARVIEPADGRAPFTLGVMVDTTELERTTQALLESRRGLSALTRELLSQEQRTSQRVAQAMHDRLGQTLAGARFNADVALAEIGPEMPGHARVLRVSRALEDAMSEVRDVLAELRPPLLEAQGLAAALDNEVAVRGDTGAAVDVLLEVHGDLQGVRWPPSVEYNAFMIAREAIANAVRHAGASLVRVVLQGTPSGFEIAVIDDGRGLPPEVRAGRPGHLGIVGMLERASGIGAAIEMRASADGGTVVRLTWPDAAA